jgi:DNA-binding NarL/FixJ family response regulator
MSLEREVVQSASEPRRIRCLLADDHILVREGVRRLLEDEPDIEVVAEAGDAREALWKVEEQRPDVVLMDTEMPGLSSFEAARTIQRDWPDTKLIFLTTHDEEESVMQGMMVGAAGYVLKDTPAQQLVTVMRDVYRGRKYLSPETLGRLVDDVRERLHTGGSARRGAVLTPREHEVMKLLAEGNSVRQVAGILGVSVKTAEAHKFNLMRKLDIHNKVQLVTYAIQKRIVKLPVEH